MGHWDLGRWDFAGARFRARSASIILEGDGYMLKHFAGVLAAGVVLGAMGCHEDRPHDYGEQRPPVDQLDPRDSGLQSKDVIAASDKMAMDILGSIPELNESPHRWTVVVDHVDNLSADRQQNYDIF